MFRTLIGTRSLLPVSFLIAGGLYQFRPRSRVLCDTGFLSSNIGSKEQLHGVNLESRTITSKGVTRLGGRLDYYQLTYGSFTGMVAGWVFGRISKYLVFFIVSTLMSTEYLKAKHLIDTDPITTAVFNWSSKHLNEGVSLDNPSFKVTFLASFLIAAINS